MKRRHSVNFTATLASWPVTFVSKKLLKVYRKVWRKVKVFNAEVLFSTESNRLQKRNVNLYIVDLLIAQQLNSST